MNYLISILMASVVVFGSAIAATVVIWAGLTRCKKCGGWCVNDADCKQRRKELRMW